MASSRRACPSQAVGFSAARTATSTYRAPSTDRWSCIISATGQCPYLVRNLKPNQQAASQLTWHSTEIRLPIDNIVTTAAMIDLRGANKYIETALGALETALQPTAPKVAQQRRTTVQITNPGDLDMDRFGSDYAKELASLYISSCKKLIDEHNRAVQLQQQTSTTTKTMTTTTPLTPTKHTSSSSSKAANPTLSSGSTAAAGIKSPTTKDHPKRPAPPHQQQADSSAAAKRIKTEPPLSTPGCGNCGSGLHKRPDCRETCRSCGKHHQLTARCKDAQKQCSCNEFPHHTFDRCREVCRYCSLVGGGGNGGGSGSGATVRPHRNPWACPHMCCQCGDGGHSGLACEHEFSDCSCPMRHLGQDCPIKRCLAPWCPKLNCQVHCYDGGLADTEDHQKKVCDWRRVVDMGEIHLKCIDNPWHVFPIRELALGEALKTPGGVRCTGCRDGQ
ncbi:hypothetical protein B0T19DRAFT_138731 [Cercophora scortea]|uniref:Uncharacterized protein n=1 Tax=Cercophora scortea TaxID=314031 RepID=A0AAE0IYV0_9PEZI|nr:hypothetical protein B0T19DRAFT_138731 [Cercophora scortea]